MTPEGPANYFMATLNSFRVVTAVHVYGSQATSDGRDPSSNAKPCIVLLLLVKACMHERKCGSLVLDCDGQGEATYCEPPSRCTAPPRTIVEAANEESSCEEGSGEEAAKGDLASHATPSGCGEKFPLGTIARPQSRPIATWTAPRQRYVPCGMRRTMPSAGSRFSVAPSTVGAQVDRR